MSRLQNFSQIFNPNLALLSYIMLDEKLFSECEVSTFRASGRGGQHVQKTNSAVRLRHIPTGVVVSSQAERSQYINKQICLKKLKEKPPRLLHSPKRRVPTKR